jgi:hypothetical protein
VAAPAPAGKRRRRRSCRLRHNAACRQLVRTGQQPSDLEDRRPSVTSRLLTSSVEDEISREAQT